MIYKKFQNQELSALGLGTADIDAYLDDEQYGIYTYLTEQKQNGIILEEYEET